MSEDENWVYCPSCNRKVAKKKGKGRWETAMKKDKKTYFRAEIIVGTIPCPRCETKINFPLSSYKEPITQGA